MKLYGLYSEKKVCLMGFSFSSNNEEFCDDVEVILSPYFRNLWVTPKKEVAENIVKVGPTAWYNAGYETPNWDDEYYGPLKVVDLNEWEK